MIKRNLLPKISDKISFIYLEHSIITKNKDGVVFSNKEQLNVSIPISNIVVLMIGPGSSVSSAAIEEISKFGCFTIWCGEYGVRYYAHGECMPNDSQKFFQQANLLFDETKRIEVCKKMFRKRFQEDISGIETINELRGLEGVRMRKSYSNFAKKFNVEWNGRSYDPLDTTAGDLVNKCLSAANSCLYGISHAVILSLGYSPTMGFIHTGNKNSFVFDIADLYKTEISIPIAFEVAGNNETNAVNQVRFKCRDYFNHNKFLNRIVSDIEDLLK